MFCAKVGWKPPCGSGEEDFKTFSIMYFYYFAIISTLRRAWPFIWKKNPLNPINTMMLCAKFSWNCSSGSGEVDF